MLKTCATLIFPGCAKFGVVVVVVPVLTLGPSKLEKVVDPGSGPRGPLP